MTGDYRERARWGAGLLAIIAVLGSAVLGYDAWSAWRHPRVFSVPAYLERYRDLRPLLPPHGIVGYLSEEPRDARLEVAVTRSFYLTGYALAPLIVVRDPHRPLVICNVQNPLDTRRVCRRPGLVVVRDFGDGLALLRRERP